MLLSEILQIAKDKRKQLNESFKSSVIKKIFDDIDNSTYRLEAFDKKSGRQVGYPKDSYNIEHIYNNLYKEGKLTQDWFDDPEKRDEILSLTYRKETGDRKYRKKISPMQAISDSLRRFGLNIDLSSITDDDLEKEWMFDNREKPSIKKHLIFWFNSDDQFVAISYGKEIIVYNKINSLSWYKVNPEYTGPTNLVDMIDYNGRFSIFKYEAFKDFLDKAFIKIPKYNLYFQSYYDKEGFKDLMKQNKVSLTQLIRNYDISYGYVLNKKHQKNVDISDKITNRTKYREFLKQQEKWYKQTTTKKRACSLKISQQVYDAYEAICDALQLLHTKEFERLQHVSDNQFSEPFEDTYKYEVPPIIAKTYYDLIGKEYPEDKDDSQDISIMVLYEGQMFSLVTAYILHALHLCDILLKQMESIEVIKNSKEQDVDNLISEYNDMIRTFKSLTTWLSKLYKFNAGYMAQLYRDIDTQTGVDIREITDVFKPYFEFTTVYV